ncbi:MAP7 domain-containing protein 3-like [Engraulis encrasicolus]|uniref:MAP7 domain-containing protein 3-like n=1 Tax=Engraulis encrasicolus TaxID=184585 RepID=UPI002FD32AE1
MEYEINAIFHHVDASHKQACSDLEKASQFITEALKNEVQRNTTLHMLIHRLEERAGENGRSQSEQVESNRQLKLQVDELQKQLEEKDDSLTQAKQSIAILTNELTNLQLQGHQSSCRTIQEVTEGLQEGESQADVVKEEDGPLQNVDICIKEEDDAAVADGYQCTQSDETDSAPEQITSSSADIKAESVQEEEEKSDLAPVVSSDVAPVVSSDVAPVVSSDLAPVVSSDVAPVVSSDVAPVVSSDVAPGVSSDLSQVVSSAMSQFPPDSPSLVKRRRLSVQVVDCCATQGQQKTQDRKNNTDGENSKTGTGGESQPVLSAALPETTLEKHLCSGVDKSFSNLKTLKAHKQTNQGKPQLTHTKEKPHQCKQCKRWVISNNTSSLTLDRKPINVDSVGKGLHRQGASEYTSVFTLERGHTVVASVVNVLQNQGISENTSSFTLD